MPNARAVIVDGKVYETIIAGAKAVNGAPGGMWQAMRKGPFYKGHTVGFFVEAEETISGWKAPRAHVKGEPLLPAGHVTHRLGTYREQRV